MATTYTKLKSGEWGVKVEGAAPAKGASVTVVTKSGKVKTEIVRNVVWSGNGIALCAIDQRASGRSRHASNNRPPRGKIECDECGDYVTPGSTCWETGCRH